MIASALGGLLAIVVIALLVVVSKAVMRTAQNASELMEALEDVRARTAVLADLEARSADATRVADQARSALHELRVREGAGDPEENGRDRGH